MVIHDETVSRLEATVNRLEGMIEIILPRVQKIDSLAEAVARLEEQGKSSSEDRKAIKDKLDKLCTEESSHLKEDDKLNFVKIFWKKEPVAYLIGTMIFFQLLLVTFGLDELLKLAVEYIKKRFGF